MAPPDPIAETFGALQSPLLAVTTHYQARGNGLSRTGVFASLVPEAPRVLVELTKTSLTHDLVLASRVLALRLLPATPTMLSARLFPWGEPSECARVTTETSWRGLPCGPA